MFVSTLRNQTHGRMGGRVDGAVVIRYGVGVQLAAAAETGMRVGNLPDHRASIVTDYLVMPRSASATPRSTALRSPTATSRTAPAAPGCGRGWDALTSEPLRSAVLFEGDA